MRSARFVLPLVAAAACAPSSHPGPLQGECLSPDAACGAPGRSSDGSVVPFDSTVAPDTGADATTASADAAEAETSLDAQLDGPDGPPPIPIELHVPGTQVGDISISGYVPPDTCRQCHVGNDNAPVPTWSASLMASAGRDPLFFAQLATASQDVAGVGTYCVRCHVPLSVATGDVAWGRESALSSVDRQGVACHVCHSLVDPLADGGSPPNGDPEIVASLGDPPAQYGNAMFVIDPAWLRRGPYTDAAALHPATYSSFTRRAEMCGTCHDVGNPRVMRRADGTYQYAPAGQSAPDPDPRDQFPLERTYTEWKLSAFADGGVDSGGLFGGEAGTGVVSTCQDCHMPRVAAAGCLFAGSRPDLARHDFAGASAWVLGIIAKQFASEVDASALAAGQANATAMVQRAATLDLASDAATLHARVTNRSGHKIPTGHIEGRRIWLDVVFTDASGTVLAEDGRWDPATGDLDETTTTVFEMAIGLSPQAAAATGLEAGVTMHMSLADLVVKDNRIPPAGFVNAAYEAAGAGAVGATYADGQNWADVGFAIPAGASHAHVTLWYQSVTRRYVEGLRDGNRTDLWGATLYSLWQSSGNGPPIAMATADIALP